MLLVKQAKILFTLDLPAISTSEGIDAGAPNAQLANLHLYQDITVPTMPNATFAPPDTRRIEVDVEVASVGAETEDDPVNMAMRATMTDGSSLEDEDRHDKDFDDDEEEEQMVWGGR